VRKRRVVVDDDEDDDDDDHDDDDDDDHDGGGGGGGDGQDMKADSWSIRKRLMKMTMTMMWWTIKFV